MVVSNDKVVQEAHTNRQGRNKNNKYNKYKGICLKANKLMSSSELDSLKTRLRDFAKVRDWDQFHSPKNLSMALSVEVSEIVEHFQWLTEEQSKNLHKDKLVEVETELADTLIYLIRLADKLDIDLLEAANRKIKNNEEKYPVDKVQGSAKKYTEYE